MKSGINNFYQPTLVNKLTIPYGTESIITFFQKPTHRISNILEMNIITQNSKRLGVSGIDFITLHKPQCLNNSRGMEGELVVGLIGLEFCDSSWGIQDTTLIEVHDCEYFIVGHWTIH